MADQPSFSGKLKMSAKDLWNNHKVFFVIFGALLLIVKFRDVLIDLLVSSAKNTLEDAKKEDGKLEGEENRAKSDADKLVQAAKEEPLKEKPVDADWYKKK